MVPMAEQLWYGRRLPLAGPSSSLALVHLLDHHPAGCFTYEIYMETTAVYWGYIGIMDNKMETTIVYWGYIGIMENKLETTIVYWGYIGIMAQKMETTIVYWGYIGILAQKMETTVVYSMPHLSGLLLRNLM